MVFFKGATKAMLQIVTILGDTMTCTYLQTARDKMIKRLWSFFLNEKNEYQLSVM